MTPAFARAAVLPIVMAASACGSREAGDAGGPPTTTAGAAAARADRPARGLQHPQSLPRLARSMLDDGMLEHGVHMENLLWAALMVDFETTRLLADAMAATPRVARPPAGEDVLNALFPPRFFELQDELYLAIGALGAAAADNNDSDLADAYARLATTCVTCHSIYLQTDLPVSPPGATTP